MIPGIFHFTVAIPGGKTIPYNEEALSLIADTPNTESFFRVTGTTSIAESAMYVVDMIAGAACLENLRDHIWLPGFWSFCLKGKLIGEGTIQ